MKDNRGQITIMTIIIVICLIIFGGICIFMLTGENGLFVLKGQETENRNEVVNENTTNTNQTENNNVENTTDETNNSEQSNQEKNTNGALTVPMN